MDSALLAKLAFSGDLDYDVFSWRRRRETLLTVIALLS